MHFCTRQNCLPLMGSPAPSKTCESMLRFRQGAFCLLAHVDSPSAYACSTLWTAFDPRRHFDIVAAVANCISHCCIASSMCNLAMCMDATSGPEICWHPAVQMLFDHACWKGTCLLTASAASCFVPDLTDQVVHCSSSWHWVPHISDAGNGWQRRSQGCWSHLCVAQQPHPRLKSPLGGATGGASGA